METAVPGTGILASRLARAVQAADRAVPGGIVVLAASTAVLVAAIAVIVMFYFSLVASLSGADALPAAPGSPAPDPLLLLLLLVASAGALTIALRLRRWRPPARQSVRHEALRTPRHIGEPSPPHNPVGPVDLDVDWAED